MEAGKKDITERADIELLVNEFYKKVGVDELLGGIFHGALGQNWQPHLEKMYAFWHTILLPESTYSGRPFAPHASLPVEKKHFDRWLDLFRETVDEYFQGDNAAFAIRQSVKMADMFQQKLRFLRSQPDKFIQ